MTFSELYDAVLSDIDRVRIASQSKEADIEGKFSFNLNAEMWRQLSLIDKDDRLQYANKLTYRLYVCCVSEQVSGATPEDTLAMFRAKLLPKIRARFLPATVSAVNLDAVDSHVLQESAGSLTY